MPPGSMASLYIAGQERTDRLEETTGLDVIFLINNSLFPSVKRRILASRLR